MTGFHGEQYSDGEEDFCAKDEFNTFLKAKVGPFFNGNNISPEKALWIELGDSEIALSEDTFEALVEHVRRRFADWKNSERKN